MLVIFSNSVSSTMRNCALTAENTPSKGTRATANEEMTTSVATQKEAETLVAKQQVSRIIDHNSPHDLVAVVGQNISLSCSSPVKTWFFWSHYRASPLPPFSIEWWSALYDGDRIIQNDQIASRMTVSNCYARKCTLHLHELQIGADGFFHCSERDVDKYWSLTVLGE